MDRVPHRGVPRNISGWREMRIAWKRQQQEPDYQYNKSLPSTANPIATSQNPLPHVSNDSEVLAASIGTIAPEEETINC